MSTVVQAVAPADTLVGRQAERERLARAANAAERGRATVVALQGAVGLGKTALLDRCGVDFDRRGFRVLTTQGRAADAELAFASLLTLLRPVESELDELAGEGAAAIRSALAFDHRRTDPDAVRLAVFRVVTTLAGRGPVAMMVDDAHLLDGASADVLAFALGRLGLDPVVVVHAGEPDRATALDGITGDTIHLAPLGPAEVWALVSAASTLQGEQLRRCAELSAGNPLAALELAAAFEQDGAKLVDAGPALPRPVGVLGRAIAARLEPVTEPVRHALAVVAADDTGDRAVIEDALHRLGESSGGLVRAEAAGLIRLTASSVDFAHPLLRPVAYHGVAPASRRAAHRALAAALEAPHQGASRAWQLAAAAEGTDETAASALELVAADAHRRGAASSAARTAEQAAALSPTAGRRRSRLVLAMQAWLAAGHDDAATKVADQLAGLAPTGPLDGLSPAERRVAAAVAGGRTNKEVASDLFLSVKTVDFHLQHIYRKLAIRSRTELAVLVQQRGQPKPVGASP